MIKGVSDKDTVDAPHRLAQKDARLEAGRLRLPNLDAYILRARHRRIDHVHHRGLPGTLAQSPWNKLCAIVNEEGQGSHFVIPVVYSDDDAPWFVKMRSLT